MEERYLNEHETAEITGLSVFTLRNDRHLKRGLPYSKIGSCVRYSTRDIHEFMARHRIETQEK
jgi:hypothetical protein